MDFIICILQAHSNLITVIFLIRVYTKDKCEFSKFCGGFLHIKINWQYLSRLTVHTGEVIGICLWIIYFSSSQPFSYFFFFVTNCSQRILKHIRDPFYFIFCRYIFLIGISWYIRVDSDTPRISTSLVITKTYSILFKKMLK